MSLSHEVAFNGYIGPNANRILHATGVLNRLGAAEGSLAIDDNFARAAVSPQQCRAPLAGSTSPGIMAERPSRSGSTAHDCEFHGRAGLVGQTARVGRAQGCARSLSLPRVSKTLSTQRMETGPTWSGRPGSDRRSRAVLDACEAAPASHAGPLWGRMDVPTMPQRSWHSPYSGTHLYASSTSMVGRRLRRQPLGALADSVAGY